jgi:hypothetical protein
MSKHYGYRMGSPFPWEKGLAAELIYCAKCYRRGFPNLSVTPRARAMLGHTTITSHREAETLVCEQCHKHLKER